MTALLNSAALMWVLSVITLTAGLAMVLAHNVWSGGVLPLVVTLVGWATLIKGMLFLFLPSGVELEFILSALRKPLLFYADDAVARSWHLPDLRGIHVKNCTHIATHCGGIPVRFRCYCLRKGSYDQKPHNKRKGHSPSGAVDSRLV